MKMPHDPGESVRLLTEQIEYVSIASLKSNPRNARTHSPKQISQIARSIAEFGFNTPVLIDASNMVLAGHGRIEAARQLRLETVPALRLNHLDKDKLRAFVLADNQLALKSGWDIQILSEELSELIEFDLDLSVTGFDWPEIDAIIHLNENEIEPDPIDRVPAAPKAAVTRLGDIWNIGRHRLICGDSTKLETFQALLGDRKVRMVFSDPPYNVPINGHVSGLGKNVHREFEMGIGEMSETEFIGFLRTVFRNAAACSTDGALHYQCMDWRHSSEIQAAGRDVYSELKNICVWAKTNAGMGSLYRSQHEFVYVFKVGHESHVNNVELGRHGRYRTNVWSYAGANSFSATRDEDLAMHPTVKPVALIADAIRDASRPKEIVLDPFAGSGSTLVAAEKTRRTGFGVELDPIYCDVIVHRLSELMKVKAVHAATGMTWSEIAQQRSMEVVA